MKNKLKKVGLFLLKVFSTKAWYCEHIEKLHQLEYRGTIVDTASFIGVRKAHINVCNNCGFVLIVDA